MENAIVHKMRSFKDFIARAREKRKSEYKRLSSYTQDQLMQVTSDMIENNIPNSIITDNNTCVLRAELVYTLIKVRSDKGTQLLTILNFLSPMNDLNLDIFISFVYTKVLKQLPRQYLQQRLTTVLQTINNSEASLVSATYFIKFLAMHDPSAILLCNVQFLKIAKKSLFAKSDQIQLAVYKSLKLYLDFVSNLQTFQTQTSASKLFTKALKKFTDLKLVGGSLLTFIILLETVPTLISMTPAALAERVFNIYSRLPTNLRGRALYLLVLLHISDKYALSEQKLTTVKESILDIAQQTPCHFSSLALLKYIEHNPSFLSQIDLPLLMKTTLSSQDLFTVKNGFSILQFIANSPSNLILPNAKTIAQIFATIEFSEYYETVVPYILNKYNYLYEIFLPLIKNIVRTRPEIFSNVHFLKFLAKIPPLDEPIVPKTLFSLVNESDSSLRENVADALMAQSIFDSSDFDLLPIKIVFTLALTDPSAAVRARVLKSFPESCIKYLTTDEILSNLSSIVKDEVVEVRIAAIQLLGKIAKFNPFGAFPILRRVFLDFLCILDSPKSFIVKLEVTSSVQAILEAGFDIFPTYSQTFCDIVLRQLSFQVTSKYTYFEQKAHSMTTINLTKAIGYIAERNFNLIKTYVIQFHNLFLWMLQQRSDKELKLAVVTTMYSILTQLDNFYDIEISHAFPLLISIASTWNSRKLNVAVLKLMGYIGAIDIAPMGIDEVPNITDDVLIPDESNEFLLCFTSKLLIDLVKNSSLAIHHHLALQALANIFATDSDKGNEYFIEFIHILLEILGKGANYESLLLLKNVCKNTPVARLTNVATDIIDYVQKLWSSPPQSDRLLSIIIELIPILAIRLSDKFAHLIPQVTSFLLTCIYSHSSNDIVIIEMATNALMALRKFSQDYFFLIVPEIISLANSTTSDSVCIQMLKALRVFVQNCDTTNFVSSILRCSIKSLQSENNEVVNAALQVIYSIVVVLGADHFSFYQSQVRNNLIARKIDTTNFDLLLKCEKSFSDFNFIITTDPSTSLQIGPTKPVVQTMKIDQIVEVYNFSGPETPWNRKEWWHDIVTITIHNSPSHYIRCCSFLTANLFDLAEPIFNPAFLVLWKEMTNEQQSKICGCLTVACLSDALPNSIKTTLVRMFEFMEQCEYTLEIEKSVLLKACEESSQYAKALYFAHRWYYRNSSDLKGIENLIRLSSHLGLSKTVKGLSCNVMNMTMQARWCEQLGQWEKAEKLYLENKDPKQEPESYRGLLRCLLNQKSWDEIILHMKDISKYDEESKNEILPIYAIALFQRQKWDKLGLVLQTCPMSSVFLYIIKSLYYVSIKNYTEALQTINDGFDALASLSRSVFKHDKAELYPILVKAQQLHEVREIIMHTENLVEVWEKRIKLCRQDFDTYHDILSVRLTHMNVNKMIPSTIKMLKIALKRDEIALFDSTFNTLFPDETKRTIEVKFLYIKGMWARGRRIEAVMQLNNLLLEASNYDKNHEPNKPLNARLYYYCAHWILQLHNTPQFRNCFKQAVVALERSLSYESTYYNSWHRWSWANSVMFRHQPKVTEHASNAITGFCRCVQLRQTKSFSDLIQMISLFFRADFNSEQFTKLSENIEKFNDETFLQIIPQLFAQFTSKKLFVVKFVSQVVSKLLPTHFHALLFPLLLLARTLRNIREETDDTDSDVGTEEDYFEEIFMNPKKQEQLDKVEQYVNNCTNRAVKNILQKFFMMNPDAVSQSLIISEGLLLCSTSTAESWFESISTALRALYKSNGQAAFRALTDAITLPMRKDDSEDEHSIKKRMGDILVKLSMKEKSTNIIELLADLWKQIKKYLNGITQVKAYVTAPDLAMLRDTVIAVPGTYQPGVPPTLIQQFDSTLDIIHSKQRPRNVVIYDQNGCQHMSILKGNEDLRLDQRIMQFFELINQHINHDFLDKSRSLRIYRYTITPISKKAGLIQCIDGAETLFNIISSYRSMHKIDPASENLIFKEFTKSGIDFLTPIQRLEVLEEAASRTSYTDLRESIWLKSLSSREWVTRIINFSQSTALMSVIGYIIGLGDRHPSNLMLHNSSGALIHVDFGECFEISRIRIRFPETIPFRLTRMIVAGFGPSGIEGDFRLTAEDTLMLVQNHSDSIMAVLDIFLQEPLESDEIVDSSSNKLVKNIDGAFSSIEDSWSLGQTLDESSLEIKDAMATIQAKIVGSADAQDSGRGTNAEYIDELIKQATDMYNLSHLYHGWTPLW